MLEDTKCGCGHQNPPFTKRCEHCGKREGQSFTAWMRYEGAIRRSQLSDQGVLNEVWRFFSSVKTAILLILVILATAMIGTVLPQDNLFPEGVPAGYYREQYGVFGGWYEALGLNSMYDSWWFTGLLVMLGASLVICSLDRVIPLYQALNRQTIRKDSSFIRRQRICYEGTLDDPWNEGSGGEAFDRIQSAMRKYRYRVTVDGNSILAEKGRLSRYGPYIHHIGLILFLLALLLRLIPGWHLEQLVAVPENRLVSIPGTPYYIENRKFVADFYEETANLRQGEAIPKTYMTSAVLYECISDCDHAQRLPILMQVHNADIMVNRPLAYRGLNIFQLDYEYTPQVHSVHAYLVNKRSNQRFGPLRLTTRNPLEAYDAGPYRLDLTNYLPDFTMNEQGLPITVSNEPRAPAYIFLITGPGLPEEGRAYVYFPRKVDQLRFQMNAINDAVGGELEIMVQSEDDLVLSTYTSYLNVRMDRAVPFVWSGAAIAIAGLFVGFYLQHRRIWVKVDQDTYILGAHTNKFWDSLERDVKQIVEESGFSACVERMDKE